MDTLRYPISYGNLARIMLQDADVDDLLARARRLDRNALGQIHDRYYPEIYRLVFFRLNDPEVCEDITGDVFLRLLDALSKGGGPRINLRGWLMVTASNLVIDHIRNSYRKPEARMEEDFIENFATDGSLEEESHDRWQQSNVRKAMQRLTAEQQQVLTLRFLEEFSLAETAQLLNKKVDAIKALQFRALSSLRRFLDEMVQ